MNPKEDSVYISHIFDSINAIKDFSKDLSRKELESNRLKQSAIIREIEIIGEAVKNMSDKLKEDNKQVPWKDIAGTRDKMIHNYFGVDLDIVWDIIKKDIPYLEENLIKIVGE